MAHRIINVNSREPGVHESRFVFYGKTNKCVAIDLFFLKIQYLEIVNKDLNTRS